MASVGVHSAVAFVMPRTIVGVARGVAAPASEPSMPSKTDDLARRCAKAVLLIVIVFSLLIWGGRELAELIASENAQELDLKLARWLGENITAGHAWRSAKDGQRTYARLRSLPSSRVLREPEMRSGKNKGDGSWIVQSDGFLVDAEARGILSWVEHRFKLGATSSDSGLHNRNVRNSSVAWCTWRSECGGSAHVRRLLTRVEGALGIGREHFEDLQVVRYLPGEFYREHMDIQLTRHGRMRRAADNPRILTAFVYLSDVPEAGGGETAFTKLLASGVPPVRPRTGRLLVWPNVWTDEPSIADRRMYHEAREVRSGVKYGANIWVRLKSHAKKQEAHDSRRKGSS